LPIDMWDIAHYLPTITFGWRPAGSFRCSPPAPHRGGSGRPSGL